MTVNLPKTWWEVAPPVPLGAWLTGVNCESSGRVGQDATRAAERGGFIPLQVPGPSNPNLSAGRCCCFELIRTALAFSWHHRMFGLSSDLPVAVASVTHLNGRMKRLAPSFLDLEENRHNFGAKAEDTRWHNTSRSWFSSSIRLRQNNIEQFKQYSLPSHPSITTRPITTIPHHHHRSLSSTPHYHHRFYSHHIRNGAAADDSLRAPEAQHRRHFDRRAFQRRRFHIP